MDKLSRCYGCPLYLIFCHIFLLQRSDSELGCFPQTNKSLKVEHSIQTGDGSVTGRSCRVER